MPDQPSSDQLDASNLSGKMDSEQMAEFSTLAEHLPPTGKQVIESKRWHELASSLAHAHGVADLAVPLRMATNAAEIAAVLTAALKFDLEEHPKHLAKPVSGSLLNFYAYHKKATRYRTFQIPKRTPGELRDIKAPDRGLLRLQRLLLTCLTAAFTTCDEAAHGFVAGRNVLTNAQPHVGRRYVLNLDLKDFFSNTSYGRVEAILKIAPFSLSATVARLVANLCCDQACLPQGAPTSPLLTNAVCQRLDRRMRQLANRHRAIYTRYADDLTFSSERPAFREKFHAELKEILDAEGYQENPKKQRLQMPDCRQEVTGIVVNERPNVPREYIREIRAMLHNWEIKGYEVATTSLRMHYSRSKASTRNSGNAPKLERVLAGKIAYLGMIRGLEDNTYLAFSKNLLGLLEQLRNERQDIVWRIWKTEGIEAAIIYKQAL